MLNCYVNYCILQSLLCMHNIPKPLPDVFIHINGVQSTALLSLYSTWREVVPAPVPEPESLLRQQCVPLPKGVLENLGCQPM
ncbi:hypothetical protein FKM82_017975 [Ascaphus truei]